MYELTDKHGNILCFSNGGYLSAIKRKWYNVIYTLIAESFNKSISEYNKMKFGVGGSNIVNDNNITEISENDDVFFIVYLGGE